MKYSTANSFLLLSSLAIINASASSLRGSSVEEKADLITENTPNSGQEEGRRELNQIISSDLVENWVNANNNINIGLSCVIRLAFTGGRVLGRDGRDVTVQNRNYNSANQRWILHNRRAEDRSFNIWAQDGQQYNFLSTNEHGNVDLHDRDDGSGRQRWRLGTDGIPNRYDHQFTIGVSGGTRDYKEYISNWNGQSWHVELTPPISDQNQMVWELIDCYETPAPRFFEIREPTTNRVLDIEDNNCGNGSPSGRVIIHSHHGGFNQQFWWGPNGTLMSRRCNRALVVDPYDTQRGTFGNVRLANVDGTNSQSWHRSGGAQDQGTTGLAWNRQYPVGGRNRTLRMEAVGTGSELLRMSGYGFNGEQRQYFRLDHV